MYQNHQHIQLHQQQSNATHENCTGVGDVYVRKFRYLKRSKARTVPSSELDIINCPLDANSSPVIVDECSENVTKQKPLDVFHNLI
jgi:hypothetical protein